MSKIKPHAFTEFIKRYGEDALLDCLERNEKAGIVYHRDGINGDYDNFGNVETLNAVASGDLQTLRRLISGGANVNVMWTKAALQPLWRRRGFFWQPDPSSMA